MGYEPPRRQARRRTVAPAGSNTEVAQRHTEYGSASMADLRYMQSPAGHNRSGLPDQLKTGIEALSGVSMAEVNVHYNSSKPGQLEAHAYAQGTDIYLASGQERHLPHEAWHIVQQKQGRVRPTFELNGGVAVNDDATLEHEAEMMGSRALSTAGQHATLTEAGPAPRAGTAGADVSQQGPVIQAVWARLNQADGDRLNLTSNGGGTYTHSATGRRYRAISDDPLVVVALGGDEAQAEERRPNRRRRRSTVEAVAEPDGEPVASDRVVRARLSPPEASGTPAEVQEGGRPEAPALPVQEEEQPVNHTLSETELSQVGRAATHRWADRAETRRRRLYADNSDEFLSRACWNWALTGGTGEAINPSGLFDMLGDMRHDPDPDIPRRTQTFQAAWNLLRPGPREARARSVYNRFQPEIRALWDRRRALDRDSEDAAEVIESINNDAVRLAMRMNNLEPADADEDTRLSIAMARDPDAGVNWSHWGLEVDGHSFETIPGWGLWHQREGFEHWAENGPREDSEVTRVPLRNLTPGHAVGIRGLLNIMGSGTSSSNGGRSARGTGRSRRGRAARTTSRSTRPSQAPESSARDVENAPAPAHIAPGNNLDAGGMFLHYQPIIHAANQGGTYSAEFHWVRDNPAAARHLLQQGGMTGGAAQVFVDQFAAAVQQLNQQAVDYVDPGTQAEIMTSLGIQEQLFAIIRYLRAQGAQPSASSSGTSDSGASSSTNTSRTGGE